MATIPGFTAGNYYPAGSAYAQGMSFGTPRDWTNGRGGQQLYDERYAKPLYRESTVASNPGAKPSSGGGVVGGSRAPFGTTALPWQTNVGGGGGFGDIQTSIEPRPIYSDAMTRGATNLAVAEHQKAGYVPDILKRYDQQGISRGRGQVARALGDAAASNQAARRAAVELPLEDAFTNARAILGGQVGREGEAQGWAQVLMKLLGNEQDLRFGLAGAQNDFLGSGLNLVNSLFA